MAILTRQEKKMALAVGMTFEEFAAIKYPIEQPAQEIEYSEAASVAKLFTYAEMGLPIDARQRIREAARGQNTILDQWMDQNPLPEGDDD